MMNERELRASELGLRTQLLNLTLLFRKFRRGEIAFEATGLKFFEDQMLELRSGIDALTAEYGARLRESTDTLRRAAVFLERHAPKTTPAHDLLEFGELLARSESLTPGADALLPGGAPVHIGVDLGSEVYPPPENTRKRGFLADMAKPALGDGPLRPVRGENVVLFRAVPRKPDTGGVR